MSSQASSGPILFNEAEYRILSEAIPQRYRQNCRELFGSDLDRTEWLEEFTAFKKVLALSMCSLKDDNMARVNNCQFTLLPLATYHEVTTRLCRELEEFFNGVGERLSREKVVANARELQVAREAVCEAWKRDIRAGALAGLARGRGGEGAGGA